MAAAIAPMFSSSTGRAVETGLHFSAEELAALHARLVLQFRSMVEEHRPGSAFVAPYPRTGDVSPNEILVIPFRSGAALFCIGFLQCDRTTMLVRIGDHGVFQYSADNPSNQSLAATAELLLTLAMSGRYREEIWTDTRTGRYEGGQSYFLDGSQEWQELGPGSRPPASLRASRHRLTMEDRGYESY